MQGWDRESGNSSPLILDPQRKESKMTMSEERLTKLEIAVSAIRNDINEFRQKLSSPQWDRDHADFVTTEQLEDKLNKYQRHPVIGEDTLF